jgi:hypothetical protein
MTGTLNRLFYGENVGSEAKGTVGGVGVAEVDHNRVYQGVVHHGKEGVVLRGPGVASQMGLAVNASAAANLIPRGVTALSQTFQQLYNLLIVSLIVCYKYRFHNTILLEMPGQGRA